MTARTRNLDVQIVVRVDSDMRDRLVTDANAHGRTVAQSIRFLLRQALPVSAEADAIRRALDASPTEGNPE